MRVAYLVNMYPKGSHTFIRREIQELERLGVTVDRFALRGWDADIVDPLDRDEMGKTRHTLKDGAVPLLRHLLGAALRNPGAYWRGLRQALAMAKGGERAWPYHIIYLAHAARILSWLKETGATHVHAHFGTNSAEIAALIHTLGGPDYSFIVHGAEVLDNPARQALPDKMAGAKFALGSCAYVASQIMYHVDPAHWDRITSVHCGLPAAAFDKPVAPLPDAPTFIAISRFSPEKGHVLILKAFAAVRAKHPDARLILVGNGPMEGQLRSMIAELGITDEVEFAGWLDSDAVQGKIREATALVHPSFSEGLPVVIMEAMTERRPVISTYVAGIPELVKDGETGWLIPAGRVDALTDAMLDCASQPKARLEAMGAAGFDRVKARHHITTEAEKLITLFRDGVAP